MNKVKFFKGCFRHILLSPFLNTLSHIPGRLVEDPNFRCRRRFGNARAIDGRPCVEVQLADGKLA